MEEHGDFEAQRLANIKRKQALLDELGLRQPTRDTQPRDVDKERPLHKKRKLDSTKPRFPPTRTSARIASAPSKPSYSEEQQSNGLAIKSKAKSRTAATTTTPFHPRQPPTARSELPEDLTILQLSWSNWTLSAGPPTRDARNTFHFSSHPTFSPNLSPSEILQQGCFGGTYFRPLYSRTLDLTVESDYLELPSEWLSSLDIAKFVTSEIYDPEVNKYKVRCGQSIEEWEANGWINHQYDVRGWFQWYCRFFMGRRCADDDRQIGRWRRCVGRTDHKISQPRSRNPEDTDEKNVSSLSPSVHQQSPNPSSGTGRWRRMLIKKYLSMGVHEVFDDGSEDLHGSMEVSPVIHQTCHHWAWEIRQEDLDEAWRDAGWDG